jgi:hypothetical protein
MLPPKRFTHICVDFSLFLTPSEQYDSQIANLQFGEGVVGKNAGIFTQNTEVAVYSMGPMGQGETISFTLYFKTTKTEEMVLVCYGGAFGVKNKKDILLLSLKDGNPVLYVQPNRFLTVQSDFNLNDGEWHHIAVSMPSKSCLLSKVHLYIDSNKVPTDLTGRDDYIFYVTSGNLSLGGWGYSNKRFGVDFFANVSKFEGMMDDFRLWGGRPVPPAKLNGNLLPRLSFSTNVGTRCKNNKSRKLIGMRTSVNCRLKCSSTVSCLAYEIVRKKPNKNKYRCFHFSEKPEIGISQERAECNFKRDTNWLLQ